MLGVRTSNSKLIRIGVFYDGNFFFHVSNYYLYEHERKARIGINGLHQFITTELADAEETHPTYCRIIDAHYFRGRMTAHDAQARDLLYRERIFDDILMREGVVTHYLPLSPEGEKGIDVWLALEAFELTLYKQFDVSVLIASDGDYLPLVRKMNTIGTRVMVLGWDFEYTDHNGNNRVTRTSQALLDVATYPVLMHQIIDDRARKNDHLIDNLFVKDKFKSRRTEPVSNTELSGTIASLPGGYGFIKPENGGDNLFFYHGDVADCDFNDLRPGDMVTYLKGKNQKGPCAINVRLREAE